VQEDRRLSGGVAAFLPVDLVTVADGQMTMAARFDGRIQPAPGVAAVAQNLRSS